MPREKLSIELRSYAKINLFLDIEGTREDGYHLLCMVNAKISLHDLVSCSLTQKPQINLTCSDLHLPTDERNMAYQAAARFREQTHLSKGMRLHIEKKIPVAAGLAGGSSNAATVLQALNQLTYDQIPNAVLAEIGTGIGSDVPFFLEPGICVCRGIGEKVVPVSFPTLPKEPPLYGVLCSPAQHVSTPTAYRMWDELSHPSHASVQPLLDDLMQKNWSSIPSHLFNAFEPVIFKEYPEIHRCYQLFQDHSPTPPRLTGSGSNLYSLHTSEAEARTVAAALQKLGLAIHVFYLIL